MATSHNKTTRTEATIEVQLTRSEYRLLKAMRRKATIEAHLTPYEHRLVERMRKHRGATLAMAGQFAAYLDMTKDPTAAAVLMLRDAVKHAVQDKSDAKRKLSAGRIAALKGCS